MLYDTTKKGIWHFRVIGKDDTGDIAGKSLDQAFEISGYKLLGNDDGVLEPISLQRSRPQTHHPGNTPNSSSSNAAAPPDLPQRSSLISPSQPLAANSQDQGTKSANATPLADPKSTGLSNKAVYELFITTVLQLISLRLCKHTGALPLNYRTILLSQGVFRQQEEPDKTTADCDPVLGIFRTYLATTGSLVVSLSVFYCNGLMNLGNSIGSASTFSGQSILAAPFGVLALEQSNSIAESRTASLAPTPNTHALSIRYAPDLNESLWKQACIGILEKRGVARSILRGCSWVNLYVSKRKLQELRSDAKRTMTAASSAVIPWPSSLCFRKKAVELATTCRVEDNMLSGHEESHDPLGSARGWFNSTADRDEKVSKRKADRATVLPKEQNSVDTRVQRQNGQSPLALHRQSTAGAGAMYPTPPDALQNPSSVTPSFDGTVSSPGNPQSATAMVEIESTMPIMVRSDEALDDGYELSESKRHRSDSQLLGDSDNMFEDMGGDMFGENDITEADFSFFDQQPAEMTEDLPMEDSNATNNETRTDPVIFSETAQPDTGVQSNPEPSVPADEIVFAKPELKHASSYRNGQVTVRNRDGRSNSSKRESSPFDPDAVYKRVKALTSASSDVNRQTKIFDLVEFDSKLPLISKKYEHGGIYDFNSLRQAEQPKLEQNILPETDYLKRHGRHLRRLKGQHVHVGTLLQKFTEVDTAVPRSTLLKLDTSMSDGDDSSMESDQDDSSYTTDDPTSPIKSAIRTATTDDDMMSHATTLKEPELVEEPDQHLALELPRLSKPDYPEVSLLRLFSDPEPLALDVSLNSDDLVQVAQILAEQAATGSLDIFKYHQDDPTSTILRNNRQSLSAHGEKVFHALQNVVSTIFRGATPNRLRGLLDVQDVPLLGQPSRQPARLQPRAVPGRESNAEQLRPSNLYQIPGPHLEVRRSEAKLSVLPSAVQFWQSLGLAPSSGSKDVRAVGVFPAWNGMAENVDTFLGRLKSVYESLKLGVFEKLPLTGNLEDGILQYEVERISTSPDATMTGHGSALIESMETLRGAMSNLTAVDTNVVVYFVYSPNNPTTILEGCTAFQRFFESYQKMLNARQEVAVNEIVLQLVSADALSSPTSVVITPPSQLFKLCMETYDRCTLFGGPMPAPGIKLEQSMPRIIDFKLTTTPSASLIHENSCIHVAYAQSVDDRWITAAWTDDRGSQQATAAYCLGRRGKPSSTSTTDVAHEIWESTLQLISIWKVHWRVIITKCSPMEQHEVDFWLDLARTEIKANVTIILTTVDTSPSLQLTPPAVRLPHSTVACYTTPDSTPQANVVSPEQSATPATPMRDPNVAAATPNAESPGETDAGAVLVDVTDQTWAAILGHRLSNSSSVLELQPALASGYLIKRTSPQVEDSPVIMEVNLIHTEATPRAYEPLLREMLSHFRGLGTLARARGVTETETDVRPWHVAAAEKAERALYLLM